ncbi:MAG: c-type cytochrome [Cocleimonas sp.]
MKKLVMFALVATIGLTSFANASEAKKMGDADKGKALSASCAACHGADGNSSNPEWPKLAGQGESYLIKQLTEYRNGKRKNAVMNGMAAAIKSDEDVMHLAAYYANSKAKPGQAKNKDIVAEGESIYRGGIVEAGVAACSACHGPTGSGNPTAKFPKVSGQHAKYSLTQLQYFKSGERNNDTGKMMRNMAKKMSTAQMEAVSEYMAGLRD